MTLALIAVAILALVLLIVVMKEHKINSTAKQAIQILAAYENGTVYSDAQIANVRWAIGTAAAEIANEYVMHSTDGKYLTTDKFTDTLGDAFSAHFAELPKTERMSAEINNIQSMYEKMIEDLEEKVRVLTAQLADAKEHHTKTLTVDTNHIFNSELQSQLDAEVQKNGNAVLEIEGLKVEVDKLTKALEAKDSTPLDTDIYASQKQFADMEAQLDTLIESKHQLEEQYQAQSTQLSACEDELQRLRARLQDTESIGKNDDWQAKCEVMQKELEQLRATSEQKLGEVEAELREASEKVTRLTQEVEDAKSSELNNTPEAGTTDEKLLQGIDALRSTVESAQSRADATQRMYEKANTQLSEIQAQLDEAQKVIAAYQSERTKRNFNLVKLKRQNPDALRPDDIEFMKQYKAEA